MLNPYDGNPANFPTTLLLPDDAERARAAAFLPALEGLADRTRALVPHVASYFPFDPGSSWSAFTWNKPSGSLLHRFYLKGGGGGGAGGLALTGAGGGGAGEGYELWVPSHLVPDTLSCYPGDGGAAGFLNTASPADTTAGGTGETSTVTGTNFSLAAYGGFGALQKPSRYTGSWPPAGIAETIGGVGRTNHLFLLSPAEHMATDADGARGGNRIIGANGGCGEWIGTYAARAGGVGEMTVGGLPGGEVGAPSLDGQGGLGAGAGGGGGRSRTSDAKGGGGASGYRWLLAGVPFRAQDGALVGTIYRGGKGAPGLVMITSFRGAPTG